MLKRNKGIDPLFYHLKIINSGIDTRSHFLPFLGCFRAWVEGGTESERHASHLSNKDGKREISQGNSWLRLNKARSTLREASDQQKLPSRVSAFKSSGYRSLLSAKTEAEHLRKQKWEKALCSLW